MPADCCFECLERMAWMSGSSMRGQRGMERQTGHAAKSFSSSRWDFLDSRAWALARPESRPKRKRRKRSASARSTPARGQRNAAPSAVVRPSVASRTSAGHPGAPVARREGRAPPRHQSAAMPPSVRPRAPRRRFPSAALPTASSPTIMAAPPGRSAVMTSPLRAAACPEPSERKVGSTPPRRRSRQSLKQARSRQK